MKPDCAWRRFFSSASILSNSRRVYVCFFSPPFLYRCYLLDTGGTHAQRSDRYERHGLLPQRNCARSVRQPFVYILCRCRFQISHATRFILCYLLTIPCSDLPFVFKADGEQEEMSIPADFDVSVLVNLFQAYMAAQQGGGGNEQLLNMVVNQCCMIL
jgi:hypothetical protein